MHIVGFFIITVQYFLDFFLRNAKTNEKMIAVFLHGLMTSVYAMQNCFFFSFASDIRSISIKF